MNKKLKYIFLPLAAIYAIVLHIRHFLFDKNILRSAKFNFPIICVGNLATGGTGKTPMVELLINLLKSDYQVATISRGYKRKTKGFAIANKHTTALEIGDEPMQFHIKFPDVAVAVGEERLVAIPQLLQARPDTRVIILDDAFQHRRVQAGLNILLTECDSLYSTDFLLPAGNLRDVKIAAKRAHIVVITKCPELITDKKKQDVKEKLHLLPNQALFFTCMRYGKPYPLFTTEAAPTNQYQVLLICGIANPAPLIQYLKKEMDHVEIMLYKDHHIFNSDDLKKIKLNFEKLQDERQTIILTTEKDAVRLLKFEKELKDMPVFVLPVQHEFLHTGKLQFEYLVKSFIDSYQPYSPEIG